MRAVNQADGFAGGKIPGIAGEVAGGDDNCLVDLFGGQQAKHFADYRRAYGKHLPLFALDEGPLPIFVEGQVHTAIGTPAEGVFDLIALSAIRFGNKIFKVFPRRCAQRVEGSLPVHKLVAFPGEKEGADGKYAEKQQGERSQGNNPFGEHLAGVVLSGPYWEPPAEAAKCHYAKRGADPPG